MNLFYFLLGLVIIVGVSEVHAQQAPSPTQDPISPLITFLQQLQGLRQLYSGGGATGRNSGNLFASLLPQTSNPLTLNSIDAPDSPQTNVNSDRVRPRLTDFFQSSRAVNFLDRLFRNGRNDQVTNTFAESLLGLIFRRNNGNSNAAGTN